MKILASFRGKWLVAVGIVGCIALAATLSNASAAAGVSDRGKWEYCVVKLEASLGDPNGYYCENWDGTGRATKRLSVGEIGADLGARLSDDASLLDLANHLGAQGWELVSDSRMQVNGIFSEEFVFKRRR